MWAIAGRIKIFLFSLNSCIDDIIGKAKSSMIPNACSIASDKYNEGTQMHNVLRNVMNNAA